MKGHPRNGCLPSALTDAKAPVHLVDDDIAQDHLNMQMQETHIPNDASRPVMPGAFGGRPSDISIASDPSPSKSLRERIGPKIEGEDGAIPRVGGWLQETQHVRRQSAPMQAFPTTMLPGRTGSSFGSGSSSSSSTSIAPNHSISQRHIQRDRTKSDVAGAFPARRLSRLGSIVSAADLVARKNEYQDDDAGHDENPGLEDDDENGSPSDGSTVNGGSSVSSFYASESDAGTFSSSGRSSSISFSALVRGSGAAPLMTAYEIGAKYVPFMRDRARRAGYKVKILPGRNDDTMESPDPDSSSREPGMVRIMISRGDGGEDIINTEQKRPRWSGNGAGGNEEYRLGEPRRRRPREPEDMYADYNPTYPPQTPRHVPNPHALGMNPQTPDYVQHPPPGYGHTPPYGPAVVHHPPQPRAWYLNACMMFFIIVFAVVVGAIITVLLLDRMSVPE